MRPRHVYLGLCVLGLVIPNAMFIPWLLEHGLDPGLFTRDLFANGVSSFFGLDVVISAIVLFVFAMTEGRRVHVPHLWMPIAAVCFVGVSFGFPMFLYQRQVQLDHGGIADQRRL
jgi:hypothetical protein